ncbi:hypothetical protein LCGC14_0225660 [marine sediment metagenome]|uniref:Type II secretion system protein GspG C-terminal domain-containing protein n=1 Tax=marine sediment metagenome TaxID=412755 RepID=A0A0F9XFN5_9ZZZZ
MQRRDAGFTLTELLIVIAIVGVLTSVVVVAARRMVASSRRVVCQTNLHQIHVAYALRKADELANNIVVRRKTGPLEMGVVARPITRSSSDSVSVLQAYGWGGVLRKYMGDNNAVMQCPSDAEPTDAFPDIRLRVWGSGGAEHSDYDLNLTSGYPHWEYGSAAEMDPQPGIWKVQAGHNPFEFPENRNNIDRLPKYEPVGDGSEYWYLVETARYGGDYHAGGDLDYNDIVFKITETATEVLVEAYQFWVGQTYNLIGPDGTIYGDSNQSVGTDSTRGPFRFARVVLSYGMNSQVVDLPPAARRILVLDYDAEVCYTGDDVGVNEGWAKLRDGRHLGRCNVLFAGGDVVSYAPDAIDPEASQANYETYWAPPR